MNQIKINPIPLGVIPIYDSSPSAWWGLKIDVNHHSSLSFLVMDKATASEFSGEASRPKVLQFKDRDWANVLYRNDESTARMRLLVS
jgi:hypothetical protein